MTKKILRTNSRKSTNPLRTSTKRGRRPIAGSAARKAKRAAPKPTLFTPEDRAGLQQRVEQKAAPKTRAKPVLPEHWGGHDLTTPGGSAAHHRDFLQRKATAEDYYRQEFGEIHEHLDGIDRKLSSVLSDLVCHHMRDTVFEFAEIASLLYMVRLAIPDVKSKATVTP